jgi:hypothetical protein
MRGLILAISFALLAGCSNAEKVSTPYNYYKWDILVQTKQSPGAWFLYRSFPTYQGAVDWLLNPQSIAEMQQKWPSYSQAALQQDFFPSDGGALCTDGCTINRDFTVKLFEVN